MVVPSYAELDYEEARREGVYLSTLKSMRKLHLKEIVSVFKEMDVKAYFNATR